MEKTRLPVGGRTAANIHPGQAEKDLERNSRSDGHACTGGKHALSMPEEPFPSARIISIARIRGTTVKAARAELPNGWNRPGTGPSSDNPIGPPGRSRRPDPQTQRPARDLPPLSRSPPIASVTSHTTSEAAAWPPSLAATQSEPRRGGAFRRSSRRFCCRSSEPKRCRNQPQEGKQRARRTPLRRRLKSLSGRGSRRAACLRDVEGTYRTV